MTANLVSNIETTQDDDGTYFKYIDVTGGSFGFLQNEKTIYTLQVEFPEEYNSAEYEGIVEYVQITIKSTQRIQ